jgi:guanylate kinase
MSSFNGKLIIICAPSGSGKTTIVRSLLPVFPNLEFSVSACSRPPRPGEVEGKDYYFLTPEAFKMKIEKGEFLEWEEVYPGSFYGTLSSEVDRIWEKEAHVIFDVDVLGGISIKTKFPDQSLSIFIKPPSLEELKKRLLGRGTENPESLKARLDKAESEMEFASRFDIVIVNDDLQTAIQHTAQTIKSFIIKT